MPFPQVLILFHILVRLGILGSGGKQNTTLAGARRVGIVAFSINSHMQTQ